MARTHELIPARSNRTLLVLALVAGLVAAILVFVALNGGAGEDEAPAGVTVAAVVAAQDIAVGTEITAEMVKVTQVPPDLRLRGAFTDPKPIVGETARYPLVAGEQITATKVGPQTKGDGLAWVVPKGMRAESLSVDETTGVGGHLRPGDRVDVIAVFTDDGVDSDLTVVSTVLESIEVLAVATKAQAPAAEADGEGADSTTADLPTSGRPPEDLDPQPNARTVTLALTPEQAQVLAFVQEKAQVYLSLRPFGETGTLGLQELVVPPPPPPEQ